MSKISRIVTAIREEERPFRFILSILLVKFGICRFFFIDREGYRLRFHAANLSRLFWCYPDKRQDEERAMTDLVPVGGICADVGANIGSTTLALAKKVGSAGRVVALEPHPRTYAFLRENLELNSVSCVTPLQLAAGEKQGYIQFSDSKYDDMNGVSRSGPIRVPVTRLDLIDELANAPRIDFLKLDIEGYELPALLGATGILKKCKTIYFESSEYNCSLQGFSTAQIFDFLRHAGFDLFHVDGTPLSSGYVSRSLENIIGRRVT